MRALGRPSASAVASTIAFGSVTPTSTASASQRVRTASPGRAARSASASPRVAVRPAQRRHVLDAGPPACCRRRRGSRVARPGPVTPTSWSAALTYRPVDWQPSAPDTIAVRAQLGTGDGHMTTGTGSPRLQARPRRRHRLRDRDRRAGQGRQRAALPRRRHRGPRRPRLVRQRVGPAGRQRVQPGAAAGRAVPDPGALRRRPGRRAVARSRCSPRPGGSSRCSTSTTTGARRPRPRLGHGDVVRRAVRARDRPPDGAAGRDRQGAHDRRAVHDPLARRAGPAARQGGRRLLRRPPPSTA